MNNNAPLLQIDPSSWIQVLRKITCATNLRTSISTNLPTSGSGDSATVISYSNAAAVGSSLVTANMNSIPFDWTARFSVGGTNMAQFIIKQLPVLPPEAYIEFSPAGHHWVHFIFPRTFELTYTSYELSDFARDLRFFGEPFVWNDERRHCLQSELDAIFAHMYGLDRSDLEWILDAPYPSSSFPGLKKNEIKEFGEYRTMRYVLEAYDLIAQGKPPDISDKKQTQNIQPVE